MNTISQNWVKVILCIVGLIIALVGIGLMAYAICALICSIMNIGDAKESLETINGKSNDLNDWLNKSEIIPEILKNESSTNMTENKTETINNIVWNFGQNKTLAV